ncbi:right-handed parallel beta-helix repeat-containing protein [Amycolatopsis anabasis]|uniref:right-handed parallel beta-helix repeat-containing protein n=1 Tax=Amycolatopsis anabasis TaxID=1840409 RepID=UPI00131E4389|nr:right-handed parallel beta-helix repeat-containing protein [Amycolatopsis anabasis]
MRAGVRITVTFGAVLAALALPGTGATAAPAVTTVNTSAELTRALSTVHPGDTIQLAEGKTFTGNFKAAVSGTESARITLRGPRSAVIKASGGRTLELTGSNWNIEGFTITGGQKGLMALGVRNTVVDGLKVHGIGHEAIHFQHGSSDNVVKNCEISDTGKETPDYGEGIYFGSAKSNWPGGTPDKSDRNQALHNRIGPNVAAEAIDVKEGTTGGTLDGNTFDGTGQTGANSGDSWVDVKGNGYQVTNNKGSKVFVTDKSYGGFEVHVQLSGWGERNTFANNTADVRSQYAYGFYVHKDGLGNKVCASNKVTNAGKGFSNVGTASGC